MCQEVTPHPKSLQILGLSHLLHYESDSALASGFRRLIESDPKVGSLPRLRSQRSLQRYLVAAFNVPRHEGLSSLGDISAIN